ncbi:MAG TPA: HK97 family phage prohead protease [Jiangellaceae bacterium]|nr:HK97 family phage prohead protease [Jiangellaceae bacterium]
MDERKQMTAKSINDLPDSAFAYIEPGGKKDEQGKTVPRSKRHFPIHDAAHVRNALARAPQSPFGAKAMPKIRAAAKKFGIDVSEKSRPDLGTCVRAFTFESRSASDGRTLEGYAAVFNQPARIRDLFGDFDEVILPGAFKRSLEQRTPVLQFEHGRDPRVGAVPIGAIDDIREDDDGLYVRARLFDNPTVEPVRQAIAEKAIRGMSFRFSIPDGGDTWTKRKGDVDLREIRDTNTAECGPVVFPAYDQTSVSVRSLLAQLDPDEHRALIRELAAEVRLAVDLSDLTGQPDQRMAGGGDSGTTSGNGEVPTLTRQQRASDERWLLRKPIPR